MNVIPREGKEIVKGGQDFLGATHWVLWTNVELRVSIRLKVRKCGNDCSCGSPCRHQIVEWFCYTLPTITSVLFVIDFTQRIE